jgi:hypothetical protein
MVYRGTKTIGPVVLKTSRVDAGGYLHVPVALHALKKALQLCDGAILGSTSRHKSYHPTPPPQNIFTFVAGVFNMTTTRPSLKTGNPLA